MRMLLRAKLKPGREGLFPNEIVAVISDVGGRSLTLLVQRDDVRDTGNNEGLVPVQLLGREDHCALVLLPGEVLDGNNLLSVRDSQLVPA